MTHFEKAIEAVERRCEFETRVRGTSTALTASMADLFPGQPEKRQEQLKKYLIRTLNRSITSILKSTCFVTSGSTISRRLQKQLVELYSIRWTGIKTKFGSSAAELSETIIKEATSRFEDATVQRNFLKGL